jgi:hypothetical protein
MAAPVISASSSILGFRRSESFAFQPAATNTPTSWAAVGLPSGLSISSSTGLISGSVATAGVYVVTVSATNADPATGSREFVIGISPEVATAADAATALDAIVLEVTVPALTVSIPGTGSAQDSAGLFSLKEDDTRMLIVRFKDKEGARVDLGTLTELAIHLKEIEPESAVVTADAWVKSGSAATAEWQIPITVTSAALAGALSNYEADAGTRFTALAEIEWERSITFDGDALTRRSSTPTFPVTIDRDIVAN